MSPPLRTPRLDLLDMVEGGRALIAGAKVLRLAVRMTPRQRIIPQLPAEDRSLRKSLTRW